MSTQIQATITVEVDEKQHVIVVPVETSQEIAQLAAQLTDISNHVVVEIDEIEVAD